MLSKRKMLSGIKLLTDLGLDPHIGADIRGRMRYRLISLNSGVPTMEV